MNATNLKKIVVSLVLLNFVFCGEALAFDDSGWGPNVSPVLPGTSSNPTPSAPVKRSVPVEKNSSSAVIPVIPVTPVVPVGSVPKENVSKSNKEKSRRIVAAKKKRKAISKEVSVSIGGFANFLSAFGFPVSDEEIKDRVRAAVRHAGFKPVPSDSDRTWALSVIYEGGGKVATDAAQQTLSDGGFLSLISLPIKLKLIAPDGKRYVKHIMVQKSEEFRHSPSHVVRAIGADAESFLKTSFVKYSRREQAQE